MSEDLLYRCSNCVCLVYVLHYKSIIFNLDRSGIYLSIYQSTFLEKDNRTVLMLDSHGRYLLGISSNSLSRKNSPSYILRCTVISIDTKRRNGNPFALEREVSSISHCLPMWSRRTRATMWISSITFECPDRWLSSLDIPYKGSLISFPIMLKVRWSRFNVDSEKLLIDAAIPANSAPLKSYAIWVRYKTRSFEKVFLVRTSVS